ncbi:hypothetical protein ACTQZS_14130 [Bilifractor sp. LCP19S3_H10]|uniref:hypothetical protein n=1 Tax=Bilifractor sp. LCP19S3_H10 TaxID=3438736 RepID=UPI003F8F5B89
MAKKTLSIAEQISALETDLASKNEEIKTYEKSIDKLLKALFGMDKKSIDKLIAESRKSTSDEAEEVPAADGVDVEISEGISASEGQSPYAI